MIRYRSSMCRYSGYLLTGFACVEQSIGRILTTQLTELVMLLDFGSDTLRLIGRNMHAGLVAKIYMEAVTAIHKWEPEYRVTRLQLVLIERTGSLGLAVEGTYYPEGRHGNYDIAIAAGFTTKLGSTA